MYEITKEVSSHRRKKRLKILVNSGVEQSLEVLEEVRKNNQRRFSNTSQRGRKKTKWEGALSQMRKMFQGVGSDQLLSNTTIKMKAENLLM